MLAYGKPSTKKREKMEISILGWMCGVLAGHFLEEENDSKQNLALK